jgi:hypothetical protein
LTNLIEIIYTVTWKYGRYVEFWIKQRAAQNLAAYLCILVERKNHKHKSIAISPEMMKGESYEKKS